MPASYIVLVCALVDFDPSVGLHIASSGGSTFLGLLTNSGVAGNV